MSCRFCRYRAPKLAGHLVAFWPKADMNFYRESAFAVAIGSKADTTYCGAYVR